MVAAAVLAAAIAAVVPGVMGGAAAAPIAPGIVRPMGAAIPAAAEWAWGAEANLSYAATYEGGFNASTLAAGNVTTTGAAVALSESLGVEYAVYVVVNATSPSPGNLSLHLAAAEYRALAISLAGSGDFPAAGVYNSSTLPPLVARNLSLVASVRVLNAESAFLNLTTGPNGSLALDNEHIASLRAVNLSLAASDLPNLTRDAAGDLHVRYVTASYSARGYVAQDLAATFAPALPLVEGPLRVGKNWTAATNASFVGADAYAAEFTASTPANGSAHWGQSGTVSANATDRLDLTFAVIGARTVYLPGGTSETDYEISAVPSGGNASVYVVDGLLVLPAADPTNAAGIPAAVPASPASAPTTASDQPVSRSLYSTQRGLPDSQVSSPEPSGSVAAAPVAPSTADAAIAELRAPGPTAAPHPGGASLGGYGLAAMLIVGFAMLVVFAVHREVRNRTARP